MCSLPARILDDDVSALDRLRDVLIAGRNADGGWGYFPGKRTRLEPTCWAILALQLTDPSLVDIGPLSAWPRVEGLLPDGRDGQVNYAFNGLALLAQLALRQGGADTLRLRALADGLIACKGLSLPSSPFSRQNNALQAWPWRFGTFSWVEPSAWCLLALKKAAAARVIEPALQRTDEAERLLVDRACRGGGWNYGNPEIFGSDLRPYVPTTALALLAMQDRQDEPTVTQGVTALYERRLSEPSGMALSLALLALRVLNRPAHDVEARLIRQTPATLSLGNHVPVAMALYALAGPHDATFRLSPHVG
jgi:hypothetical protein